MKRQRRKGPESESGVDLKLTPTTSEPEIGSSKTIRVRIKRLMSQNPVIIFSRPCCFMLHVMKSLLSAVGAHPTVIELEEKEVYIAAKVCGGMSVTPSLFIGGKCVGGLESMVGLHLRNDLVLRLQEVGALKKGNEEVI